MAVQLVVARRLRKVDLSHVRVLHDASNASDSYILAVPWLHDQSEDAYLDTVTSGFDKTSQVLRVSRDVKDALEKHYNWLATFRDTLESPFVTDRHLMDVTWVIA